MNNNSVMFRRLSYVSLFITIFALYLFATTFFLGCSNPSNPKATATVTITIDPGVDLAFIDGANVLDSQVIQMNVGLRQLYQTPSGATQNINLLATHTEIIFHDGSFEVN